MPLSIAVAQYFENGGVDAWIVRVDEDVEGLAEILASYEECVARGLAALASVPDVDLLVMPPPAGGLDVPLGAWQLVVSHAERVRALVLVDPPSNWSSVADAVVGAESLLARTSRAALYFPAVRVPDPDRPGHSLIVPPSAVVAGVMAQVDRERGVWKVPAGTGAELRGVSGMAVIVSDREEQSLTRAGVNAPRDFPGGQRLVWGGRTLHGDSGSGSEWKYVNVRRFVDYVERSIERGT